MHIYPQLEECGVTFEADAIGGLREKYLRLAMIDAMGGVQKTTFVKRCAVKSRPKSVMVQKSLRLIECLKFIATGTKTNIQISKHLKISRQSAAAYTRDLVSIGLIHAETLDAKPGRAKYRFNITEEGREAIVNGL